MKAIGVRSAGTLAAVVITLCVVASARAGTITFTGNPQYVAKVGSGFRLLTGDGTLTPGTQSLSAVSPTGQPVTSGGIDFAAGTLTYTSGADDPTTGVKIIEQATRLFNATAGSYVLLSEVSASYSQPAAGLIKNIEVSTSVDSQIFNFPTYATVAVTPPNATGMFEKEVKGKPYTYPAGITGDTLNQLTEIDISPTAAGQMFTISIPVPTIGQDAFSLIISTDEPPSSALLLSGLVMLVLGSWLMTRGQSSASQTVASARR
jgi:hypothetical protein